VDLQLAANNLPVSNLETISQENNASEWYNKGLLLFSEEKFSEALSCYDKALTQVGQDNLMKIKIINGRGSTLYGMKRFAESINAYHEAMMIDPSNVSGSVLYNLGMSYAEMQSYQDSIKCFEQALQRVTDSDTISRIKQQLKICKKLAKKNNY